MSNYNNRISGTDLVVVPDANTEPAIQYDNFEVCPETSLPKVTFSWIKGEFTYLTEEQASALPADLVNGRDARPWCYAAQYPVRRQTVTLCNFRRYGWCWSQKVIDEGDEVEAQEYGFGGPIYANLDDGGLSCESPQQVVRDTLIRAISELPVPRDLTRGLEGREAFDRLYREALLNLSNHASSPVVRKHQGYFGPDVEVLERTEYVVGR